MSEYAVLCKDNVLFSKKEELRKINQGNRIKK